MIDFKRHTLSNGMRIVVHRDPFAPIATFNLLYDVGARHENPSRTGFAHLFEHLMFSGSAHVTDFDTQVQRVGGDSNAFTTNDITNFYITLPADNIETAFWLDSDRMLSPILTQEALDVQKKVVVEEFRQRYLSRPYGDLYHILRDLCYKVHPYRWPTIGLEPQHILDATLDEVRSFFFSHYIPRHAVLAISGCIDPEKMFAMAERWFGDIERDAPDIVPPAEPEQTVARYLEHRADVPTDRICLAFHMCGRLGPDYHLSDIATDILSDGESTRLTQHLVHDQRLCTNVNAFILGSYDPGLVIFAATPAPGIKPQQVTDALWHEIEALATQGPTDHELTKARNRLLASSIFSETSPQGLAQSLARYELLGDANLINTDVLAYDDITPAKVSDFMARVCTPQNCSTLLYLSQNKL